MISEIQAATITAKQHTDDRGTLSYFSEFGIGATKRLYIIEHLNTAVVRAWQGHKKEQKWFLVISGSFKIVLIKPENLEDPSDDLNFTEINLSAGNYQVLHIPGGYINGFKALEPNSRLMVFSDFSVEESALDDFRFDKNKWYNWTK